MKARRNPAQLRPSRPIYGVAIEPIRAGDRIEFDPMTSQVRRAR